MTASEQLPARDVFVGAKSELSTRGLRSVLPELTSYLFEGAEVLDVGCGPGSITTDVARWNERPHRVVGVDQSAGLIADARARAAEVDADNLRFVVGDAYDLCFDDASFDVTYSHALLDWLEDPVEALRAQRRVTRSGGVVFTRMSDLRTQSFHPACPALEKILRSMQTVAESGRAERYWNPFLGLRAVELYEAAGFEGIDVVGWASCYRSANPDQHASLVRGAVRRATQRPFTEHVAILLSDGMLDEETVDRAASELEALIADPAGMSIRSGVFATGRVP